jgi:hypothetical protein
VARRAIAKLLDIRCTALHSACRGCGSVRARARPPRRWRAARAGTVAANTAATTDGGPLAMMIDRHAMQLDTGAWRVQVWIAFVLALATTTWGIWFVPADPWVKGFLLLGLYFTVSSAFTLAKTIRDEHESKKIFSKLGEAKAVQMLREYGEEA